jgi:hypothetical protein
MKSNKSLSIVFFLFFIFTSNSQLNITADGGSFEKITPWGEGFLGIVQTQAYAIMPKYRQYQYFDNNGKMIWNTKVDPFNFFNKYICNNESEYAYLLNFPFGKTALAEKTSKTELINIYQIDRKGKLIEKAIKFDDKLKVLEPIAKKLNIDFVGAYKDGIIAVFSLDDLKYYVVKIDNNFNVEFQSIDCEWDKKLFENKQISRPKLILGKEEFCFIQTKLNGSILTSKIITLPFDNFSNTITTINHSDFNGYVVQSNKGFELVNTIQSIDQVNHSYLKSNTYMPTLGSFLIYTLKNDELKLYCRFKNFKDPKKKIIDKEGYISFNIEINGEENNSEINTPLLFEGNLKEVTETNAYHVLNTGEFLSIYSPYKGKTSVQSSLERSQTYSENTKYDNAFGMFISENFKENEKTEFSYLIQNGDKYYGVSFDGVRNSLGNYKTAIITNF